MRLVVEEFRNVREPALIPLHLAMAKHVSNNIWVQLRKSSHVTHNIAVSSDPLHITSKVVNVTAETVVTTIGKLFSSVMTGLTFFSYILAVPGGYTDWSEWGECSVTCGGGVQKRSRTYTNPIPSHCGQTCIEQYLGPAVEKQSCNSQYCRK